jgi:plasmid replication initiation protein
MAKRAKKDLVKEPVVESNDVARAKVSPAPESVWEWRIINQLVAKNRENDKAFAVHKISFKELEPTKKLSGGEHREIKKSVLKLAHITIEIPKGNRGVRVTPIFAVISLDDDGNIEAQLNHMLKPHYLALERNFTLYSLPEFRLLSSVYSQAMFRYLHSWKNLDKGEHTATLEELHALLSTPESLRKDFRNFRSRVLEPAHREITEKTGLYYEWEPVREGLRKVVAVRFVFQSLALTAPKKTPEQEANEEHARLQHESNQCYEKIYIQQRIKCVPKKRSKRCKFCLERGRMVARLRIGE